MGEHTYYSRGLFKSLTGPSFTYTGLGPAAAWDLKRGWTSPPCWWTSGAGKLPPFCLLFPLVHHVSPDPLQYSSLMMLLELVLKIMMLIHHSIVVLHPLYCGAHPWDLSQPHFEGIRPSHCDLIHHHKVKMAANKPLKCPTQAASWCEIGCPSTGHRLKKIFGFTFYFYICSRSLWYMDIVKIWF